MTLPSAAPRSNPSLEKQLESGGASAPLPLRAVGVLDPLLGPITKQFFGMTVRSRRWHRKELALGMRLPVL